jgi:hypothetical protein
MEKANMNSVMGMSMKDIIKKDILTEKEYINMLMGNYTMVNIKKI